jgi:hypothetical protein
MGDHGRSIVDHDLSARLQGPSMKRPLTPLPLVALALAVASTVLPLGATCAADESAPPQPAPAYPPIQTTPLRTPTFDLALRTDTQTLAHLSPLGTTGFDFVPAGRKRNARVMAMSISATSISACARRAAIGAISVQRTHAGRSPRCPVAEGIGCGRHHRIPWRGPAAARRAALGE